MEILLDNTIDESTAKYFCIFANKEIHDYINDVNDNDEIIKQTNKLVNSKLATQLNESDRTSILSQIKNGLSKLKGKASNIAQNTVKNATETSTQVAIDTITSSANQEKLNLLATQAGDKAGKSAVQGAIDSYNANKQAFDAMAQDAGANATQGALDTIQKNTEQINKLAQDAGANATQGALDTAIANQDAINAIASDAGASAAAGALGTLQTAAAGAAKAAMPWLIAAGAIAIGTMLWPKIKGGFKRMFRTSAKTNNSLAFVKFKDTDNNDWQFYFSDDKMLWRLDNMNSGQDVSKQHTIAFMQTEFAKKFMIRCQQLIRSVLDNELGISVLLKTTKDKTLKDRLQQIVENKQKIYSRMFTGKC